MNLISSKLVRLWLWVGFSSLFLGAFLIVTSEVQEASRGDPELIGNIDQISASVLASVRNPMLNNVAIDVTALGSVTIVLIFVLYVSTLLVLKKRYFETLHLVLAGAGSALITSLLKPHFERARPTRLIHLVDVQGYSYPSGHSVSSAAVYFTFAVLLSSKFQRWVERSVVIGLSFCVIFLVALSRVYLGVHYFSDVLAGTLVGVSWASLLGGAHYYLRLKVREDAVE